MNQLIDKKNQVFEQNNAATCDHIYGDAFVITESSVGGIGNNVSLEFKQMDFTSEGATRLVVYGKSPIDKNTIHIRFANEAGENNQLIEFTLSDDYEERVFDLDKITGIQNLIFIFLPGSNFDFGWFRFDK